MGWLGSVVDKVSD